MTVNEMYTVVNQSHWGVLVPLYFFLISISAGSLIIASLNTVFGVKEYQIIVRPAAISSLIALVVAPLFLILDLQQPMRFFYVINPLNFNPSSPMSWGGWLLIVYGIVLIVFAKRFIPLGTSSQTIAESAAAASGNSNVLNSLALILAVILSAYPGFELGILKAKALWNTQLLPIYFITTSLLAGIGVIVLITSFTSKQKLEEPFVLKIRNLLISLIGISLIWIVSRSIILTTSGLESELASKSLWKSGAFLGGELGLGLILPLALLLFGNVSKNRFLLTLVAALVLIGVFSMRYSLVFAGLATVMP